MVDKQFLDKLNTALYGKLHISPRLPGTRTMKSIAMSLDAQISEAFEGIATPDDVQPKDAINNLYNSMAELGLDNKLKTVGVTWFVPSDYHMITFKNHNVPILQVSSLDLADHKKMTEVLTELESIARGDAPQATEVRNSKIKAMADKVKSDENKVKEVASKYTQTPESI